MINETLKIHLFTLIYLLIIFVVCLILKYIWNKIFLKITSNRILDNKILKKTRNGVIAFVFFSGLSIWWERTFLLIKVKNPVFEKFLLNLPKIIYSFIVFSIAFVVSGIVDAFVEWYLEEIAKRTKTKMDEEFMHLFQKVSRIVIFFIAITIILNKFNQPITSILGAAGIASFAIAFAAQDTLSNMISGFFIIIDKPFKIGDRIKLATGEIGEVVEIGMRRTKILSPENNLVIVSNSEIAKTRIVNFGFPDTKINIKFKIGIQAIDDTERVKKILMDICEKDFLITPEKCQVYLTEFNASQIVLSLAFTIDYTEEIEITDKMIEKTRKRFTSEKIDVIFIKKE